MHVITLFMIRRITVSLLARVCRGRKWSRGRGRGGCTEKGGKYEFFIVASHRICAPHISERSSRVFFKQSNSSSENPLIQHRPPHPHWESSDESAAAPDRRPRRSLRRGDRGRCPCSGRLGGGRHTPPQGVTACCWLH